MVNVSQPELWLEHVAAEQVDDHVLDEPHLLRVVELVACEDKEGARSRHRLATAQMRHGQIRLDAKLDHVKHLAVEHAAEDQVVRAFLRVRAHGKESGVVGEAHALECLDAFERVGLLGLRQSLGVRELEAAL